MEINLYILGLLCGIISYIAYKFRKLANYFYDRNIAYIPPIWPLGSDVKATLFRRHYCRSWDRIYKRLNGNKVGGFYILWKPVLMVRDAEYVANVLTKDFTHFTDRGFVVDKKLNPLEGNLFFLDGAEWKYLRSKVTPGFTPEKLKSMFESLNFCSDKLVNEYIEKVAPLGEDVDFREPLARFTTDVICLCALGIRSETMDNPDSKYREIGKLFFNVDELPAVYFFARFVLREIMSILKIRTVNKRITSFFNDIVQQVFHHRKTNRVSNHDFIQVLFDLREKNLKKLEDSGKTVNGQVDTEKTPDEFNIDDTVLAAQLFLFFVAGFETTSTTLNTLLFYLSKNPKCQEKARDEAKNVFESEGGTFTFNSLAKLKYLHNCVNETLRLVPPLPAHFRICTKDYTFPDGTEVEEGTAIVIPFHSIQRDPNYFSNPDEFNPERFDGPIAPGSFTPFGEGQRVCIGKRFSITEVKLTVAKILLTYKLKPSTSHPDPFKWHPLSFMVLHEDPLLFKFEKINN